MSSDRSTLEGKDRAELTVIAEAMGAKVGSRMRKAQIIDLILGAGDDEGADDAAASSDDSADATEDTADAAETDEGGVDSDEGSDDEGDSLHDDSPCCLGRA